LLQPAAHALLQSDRELKKYTEDFPKELLWAKTAGRASVGFHMNHITGVLDRMITYAKGESLTEEQFQFLKKEGAFDMNTEVTHLQEQFSAKIAEALTYFRTIPESTLTEKRTVGRKKLPSTVIGLLFHAAEHSQRHIGQLLVTVSVLQSKI
jgi:uncharacterized damage-inducible protein DinB